VKLPACLKIFAGAGKANADAFIVLPCSFVINSIAFVIRTISRSSLPYAFIVIARVKMFLMQKKSINQYAFIANADLFFVNGGVLITSAVEIIVSVYEGGTKATVARSCH
jgi:hypothetical protein